MCSSRQCASNDMRHDPDRDLWVTQGPWPEVKFQLDLSRSNDTPIDSPRREEHDGANPVPVSQSGKKLWAPENWPKIWPFLTSEVNGWPLTKKSYADREISSRPTRSSLSRVSSSIRGQTRGGVVPTPPLVVLVMKKALVGRGLKRLCLVFRYSNCMLSRIMRPRKLFLHYPNLHICPLTAPKHVVSLKQQKSSTSSNLNKTWKNLQPAPFMFK